MSLNPSSVLFYLFTHCPTCPVVLTQGEQDMLAIIQLSFWWPKKKFRAMWLSMISQPWLMKFKLICWISRAEVALDICQGRDQFGLPFSVVLIPTVGTVTLSRHGRLHLQEVSDYAFRETGPCAGVVIWSIWKSLTAVLNTQGGS